MTTATIQSRPMRAEYVGTRSEFIEGAAQQLALDAKENMRGKRRAVALDAAGTLSAFAWQCYCHDQKADQ